MAELRFVRHGWRDRADSRASVSGRTGQGRQRAVQCCAVQCCAVMKAGGPEVVRGEGCEAGRCGGAPLSLMARISARVQPLVFAYAIVATPT